MSPKELGVPPMLYSQKKKLIKRAHLQYIFITYHSGSLPERRSAGKTIPIVTLVDDTVPIDAELERSRHRGERIDLNVARGRIDIRDLGLAVEAVQAALSVVLEEAVEASSVDQDVTRALNPQAPCCSLSAGERRVAKRTVGWVRRGRSRTWLIVGAFGLNQAKVVVLCTNQAVLIKNVVLGCSANHPYRTLALAEDTTPAKDVDLGTVVEIVVSQPSPKTFEIGRCGGRNVESEVVRETVGV